MDYVGNQITRVRSDTRNEDAPTSTSTLGISDADILRYLNYAEERLQALILNTNSQTFQEVVIINIVSGTDTYTIPNRLYAGTRIVNVQYSPTGQARDYRDLRERGIGYRISENSSDPYAYTRVNGAIVLTGVPQKSNSTLRVTFERQIDTLDIRRGGITAASGSDLTINTSPDETSTPYNLTNVRYICVSNPDGVVQLYNGAVSSYNSGTNVLTLSAAISTYLVSGFSTANLVGSYVTFGQYTTTHCKLSDICERYLELYASYKLFKRDSSNDAKEAADELDFVEKEIVNSYQQASKDEAFIQVSNPYIIIDVDL